MSLVFLYKFVVLGVKFGDQMLLNNLIWDRISKIKCFKIDKEFISIRKYK